MTAAGHPATAAGADLARGGVLTRTALWLTAFAGAFVFVEPSPYEFAFLLLCWAVLVEGVRVPALLAAPVALLALFGIGGITSVLQVADDGDAVRYVVVSLYLCVTTVVLAACVAERPAQATATIRSAWIAGAVVAAAAGIAGYFTGFETFTLYDRARGTFQDPNVFGPFLVFPALLLMQDVLTVDRRRLLAAAIPLAAILGGLLLSFSRGAWLHFAFSAAVMVYLMLVTAPLPVARLRLALGGLTALLGLAVVVAGLMAVPQVRDLAVERMELQTYDVGETGRFGKHRRAVPELLERPLGFGPMQFGVRYGEDPHNVYINAFSAYGWLGGVSYLAFVMLTLAVGARTCFLQTPWKAFHVAAFATFAGVAAEGVLIDTDHWRHFFLLAALVWGLAAASTREGRSGRRPAHRHERAAARPPMRAAFPAGGSATGASGAAP